ncbi:MAG: twin-arginine translocase TatA/TatE family subunit [Caldilineaceae bacterium]
MPFNLGPVELGLILLIVAMLFGVGKLPEVFGSIGKGVREFRKESGMNEDKPAQPAQQPQVLPPAQAPVAQLPAASTATVAPVAPAVPVEQVPVASAPVVETKPVVTE